MVRLNLPKPRLFLVTAHPLKRALAFVIDLLIIDLVLFFPFRILLSKAIPDLSFSSLNEFVNNPELSNFLIAIAFAGGILSILYFAVLECKIKQTIGKILMKISVVSEKGDAADLKPWQCFLRSIFLLPVAPFVVLWIADILFVFFNQKRQRLLEVFSKTRTVETVAGF